MPIYLTGEGRHAILLESQGSAAAFDKRCCCTAQAPPVPATCFPAITYPDTRMARTVTIRVGTITIGSGLVPEYQCDCEKLNGTHIGQAVGTGPGGTFDGCYWAKGFELEDWCPDVDPQWAPSASVLAGWDQEFDLSWNFKVQVRSRVTTDEPIGGPIIRNTIWEWRLAYPFGTDIEDLTNFDLTIPFHGLIDQDLVCYDMSWDDPPGTHDDARVYTN